MKNNTPKKNVFIAAMIMGAGTILLLIGAMAVQDLKLNLWIILGLLMILYGVLYHLLMVRCPHCGRSLAGYRPLPRECPYCHEPLEE